VQHSGKDGLILLDQLRTVDKTRLLKRAGAVDELTLTRVLSALREVFAE